MAKITTPQAASVSFNVFIVLRQDRNKRLRNDTDSHREKYIAQHYFKAKISRKYIDCPWIGLD